MPLRPFPFPFRVGTDICSVLRIRSTISRRNEDAPLQPLRRFLDRLLTDHERHYFWNRFGQGGDEEVLTNINAISHFLAGRFAAKEACRKACEQLHPDSRGFKQIVILPVTSPDPDAHHSSRPQGLILDDAHEEYSHTISHPKEPTMETRLQPSVSIYELNGQLCEISISHDSGFATAVAIVPLL